METESDDTRALERRGSTRQTTAAEQIGEGRYGRHPKAVQARSLFADS